MTESPELLGLAIAVFGVALAVLASTILWRHQSVRLRRVVAGLLVTAAVLLYAYMPELAYNYQPAPVPASALVYTLMPLGQSANPSSTAQPNTVNALSARSGATVWHRALPDAYGLGPTVFQDTLYLETVSESGRTGHICALRGSDGAILWQQTVTGPQKNYTFTLYGGVLFVPSVTPDSQIHITALRAADGTQLWEWTGQNFSFPQTPVVTANALYFMSTSTRLGAEVVAVDTVSGKLLWQVPVELPQIAHGNIVADAGAVYTLMIGSDSNNTDIEALRGSDGSLLWTTTIGAGVPTLIASVSGIVDVQLDYGVAGLRATDGKQLWTFGSANDPHSADALYINSVALSGDTLYLTANKLGTNSTGMVTYPDTVYALDGAGGAERWKYATASALNGQLVVSPGVVFFYADDAPAALDPSSGRVLWRSQAYSDDPPPGLPRSDLTPLTFLTSSRTICRLFTCQNRFQMYLSAVNERDGVRYWTIPIGPPQPIQNHFVI